MILLGQKGIIRLKIKIHRMPNRKLIIEWKNIRTLNDQCVGNLEEQCLQCNIKNCKRSLAYEEIVTNELVTRGLLEYAINQCIRKKILRINKNAFQMDTIIPYYN